MGVTYLLRILFPFKRLVHEAFIQLVLVTLSLLMIPLSSFAGITSTALVALLYLMFGLFQGGIYSVLITLVSRHFTTDRDSLQVGFWIGNSDFGNIVGFFLCTCFIYYFQTGWRVCLTAVSLFSLAIFILFKVLLEDNRTEVVNEDCC